MANKSISKDPFSSSSSFSSSSLIISCLNEFLELWKRSLSEYSPSHWSLNDLWKCALPHLGKTISESIIRPHALTIFEQQIPMDLRLLPLPHFMELSNFMISMPYPVIHLTTLEIVYIESVLQAIIVEITRSAVLLEKQGQTKNTIHSDLRHDLNLVFPFSVAEEHVRDFTKEDERLIGLNNLQLSSHPQNVQQNLSKVSSSSSSPSTTRTATSSSSSSSYSPQFHSFTSNNKNNNNSNTKNNIRSKAFPFRSSNSSSSFSSSSSSSSHPYQSSSNRYKSQKKYSDSDSSSSSSSSEDIEL